MFREISRLFANPTRIRLVKFFVLQPLTKAASHEVASVVGVSRREAEAELKALVRAGLLASRSQGKRKYYALAVDHPSADALRVFLEDMTWPSEKEIAEAFRGLPGVQLVVATGALAKDSRSSVDLLIVARRPNDQRIKKAVRKVEINASFPLRYAVLGFEDYQARRMAHDRLLRDVFEFSHRVVSGRL